MTEKILGKDMPDLKLCKLRHTHTMTQCVIKYLQGHPMFKYFDGLPLVISIFSPLSVHKSLAEIFEHVVNIKHKRDQNNEDDADYIKADLTEESLIDCLDYCTAYF